VFSLSVAAFAVSRNFTLSVIFLLAAGFTMMIQIASSNTIIQTIVDEDKRGRVMGLYAMSFLGAMPFGSLLSGSVAAKIGVQNTLILGAACCLIGAAVFAVNAPLFCELLRPILRTRHLVPIPNLLTGRTLSATGKIPAGPAHDPRRENYELGNRFQRSEEGPR